MAIELYGLQELRWPSESKCNIPMEKSDWFVLWLGREVGHQQLVGLLISPRWKHATLSFY
jgi:hypothetical protein